MLTFVNAFKDITAGNIFNALNVTDWFSLAPEGATGTVDWKNGLLALTGTMLALMFTITTVVTVLIFGVILTFRMIALWILIVFSPLAFFAWSFEGAAGKVSSFANDWWNQFFNYCVIGPFIAFFLWLSLLTMVKINQAEMFNNYPADKMASTNMGGTRPGSLSNLSSFVIGIVMLVAGLQKASSFGVAGGSMGAKAVNAVKSRATRAAAGAAAMPGRAAKGAVKGVAGGAYRNIVQPIGQGIRQGVSKRIQAGGGMKASLGKLEKRGAAMSQKGGIRGMVGKGMQAVGKYGATEVGAGRITKGIYEKGKERGGVMGKALMAVGGAGMLAFNPISTLGKLRQKAIDSAQTKEGAKRVG
ncbi:MAG: hypothetical protein A2Y82_02855, partial [Candidatus Buchananbacteria bacterium RBG_13_36_9]